MYDPHGSERDGNGYRGGICELQNKKLNNTVCGVDQVANYIVY